MTNFQTTLEQIISAFWQQTQDASVILLHPQSRFRTITLARLMNLPDLPVFYYAFGLDDQTLQSFITNITHDLANQHPTFGRHLNLLPPRVYDNFEQHFDDVLQAFAAELHELSDRPFLLILDEYDMSDVADDIQLFVEKTADLLPDHCRMVINSRTLPRLPWVAMIAKRQAALLLDDQLIRENYYNIPVHKDYELEVFGLGPGYVLLNGDTIDSWEGHLPRLLLFFAMDRPVVTRSEICQAFWPELDPDQAVNVFHVTKRRLHKALDRDILVHDGTYYSINPELKIYFDVTEFVETLMVGRGEDSSQHIEAWNKASRIYRGPFLQGHEDSWIVSRRRSFCTGYIEALTNLAQVRLQEGNREVALKLYQRCLSADGSREDIHRDTMRIFAELGRRSEAVAHYQSYTKALQKAGKAPDPATKNLYEQITSDT